jgi:hypothetical protein
MTRFEELIEEAKVRLSEDSFKKITWKSCHMVHSNVDRRYCLDFYDGNIDLDDDSNATIQSYGFSVEVI